MQATVYDLTDPGSIEWVEPTSVVPEDDTVGRKVFVQKKPPTRRHSAPIVQQITDAAVPNSPTRKAQEHLPVETAMADRTARRRASAPARIVNIPIDITPNGSSPGAKWLHVQESSIVNDDNVATDHFNSLESTSSKADDFELLCDTVNERIRSKAAARRESDPDLTAKVQRLQRHAQQASVELQQVRDQVNAKLADAAFDNVEPRQRRPSFFDALVKAREARNAAKATAAAAAVESADGEGEPVDDDGVPEIWHLPTGERVVLKALRI